MQYACNHGVGHLTAWVRAISPSLLQPEGMRTRRQFSGGAARVIEPCGRLGSFAFVLVMSTCSACAQIMSFEQK